MVCGGVVMLFFAARVTSSSGTQVVWIPLSLAWDGFPPPNPHACSGTWDDIVKHFRHGSGAEANTRARACSLPRPTPCPKCSFGERFWWTLNAAGKPRPCVWLGALVLWSRNLHPNAGIGDPPVPPDCGFSVGAAARSLSDTIEEPPRGRS